jgi:hypothetical protein
VGGFEITSLQVNFNTLPFEAAEALIRLFSRNVIPYFADKAKAA